ncbi:hypothetical protein [Desulfofalx alkaliphila]|uniref:hypothetical protein n=1 Tax=Desulfofalx alkaliphila TaxID=105483 RepID=UPI0004E2666E|nr:hypothetical protein [Desulfofalx alkaliphila]
MFYNPHKLKKERLVSELRHYNELSTTALQLGDYESYQAVQSKIRDTFWELMAASFCDAMLFILPHVIIMWLLSIKFKHIYLFGAQIEIIIWYPLLVLMCYLGKGMLKRYRKTFFRLR